MFRDIVNIKQMYIISTLKTNVEYFHYANNLHLYAENNLHLYSENNLYLYSGNNLHLYTNSLYVLIIWKVFV